MEATAEVCNGNVVVEGGIGGRGANHDTVIVVAKPAMSTVCDGNVISIGGTALALSSGHHASSW